MAVTIRYNTFVAWGTDSSGYIEAAHRWADGLLATPSPLQFWAQWGPDAFALAPNGFRPGVIRGTEVGTYPLGLPVFMAAAIRVGGELAAYVVSPLCAGLLVWCTYLIGTCFAGPWAGLLAAGLLAASPETLVMSMQPMSDVPAAALWALAWAMSLRSGPGASAAAGAAVAAATMVRPNLAPLGLVVLLLVARGGDEEDGRHLRRRRVVIFLCLAAIGPALLAWSQNELYGSPFRTGYLRPDTLYSLAYIRPNLIIYPRLLIGLHTPLLLVGLVAPFLWLRGGQGATRDRARAVVLTATAIVAMNYLLYLPFLPFDDLTSLRFMLPAISALFILFSGLLVHLARALGSRSRVLAPLALVPALIVATHPADAVRYAFGQRLHQASASTAGYYLREALPPNAAVIAGSHSGGIAHYTGRVVIRHDPIAPGSFDEVVDDLARHGYRPVLVLDGMGEASFFKAQFATSRFHALDWPPRAEFVGGILLTYWDLADRAAFRNGHRWPTDRISTLR